VRGWRLQPDNMEENKRIVSGSMENIVSSNTAGAWPRAKKTLIRLRMHSRCRCRCR